MTFQDLSNRNILNIIIIIIIIGSSTDCFVNRVGRINFSSPQTLAVTFIFIGPYQRIFFFFTTELVIDIISRITTGCIRTVSLRTVSDSFFETAVTQHRTTTPLTPRSPHRYNELKLFLLSTIVYTMCYWLYLEIFVNLSFTKIHDYHYAAY